MKFFFIFNGILYKIIKDNDALYISIYAIHNQLYYWL